MKVNEAHKGKISGVCFADEHRLLSCGVDRNVKLWDTRQEVDENGAGPSEVCRHALNVGNTDLWFYREESRLAYFLERLHSSTLSRVYIRRTRSNHIP